jgi:hypothetical protein
MEYCIIYNFVKQFFLQPLKGLLDIIYTLVTQVQQRLVVISAIITQDHHLHRQSKMSFAIT